MSRVAVLGIYCWVWKSCSTCVPSRVSIACDKDLSQDDARIFFSCLYTGCACRACRLSRSGFSMRENSTSKTDASEIFELKFSWMKLLKWRNDMESGLLLLHEPQEEGIVL